MSQHRYDARDPKYRILYNHFNQPGHDRWLTMKVRITSPVVSVSAMTWIVYITSPVVSVSAMTWIIWYIYYRSLLYINHVFIITTKVLSSQTYVTLVDFGYPV